MKKIILSLLVVGAFISGFSKKSEAAAYVTSLSTGVLITTNTSVELLYVQVSTGYGAALNYILLVDSNPMSAVAAGNNLVRDAGNYTSDMYMIPPIYALPSTATANCNQYYSFVDKNGNGLPVERGLVLIQKGAEPSYVTVGYRKTR